MVRLKPLKSTMRFIVTLGLTLVKGIAIHNDLYGHNPELNELSELIIGILFSIYKLDNGKPCLKSNENLFIRSALTYMSGIEDGMTW